MQIGFYLRRGATTFWCTASPTINKPKMITKSVAFNVGFFIFKILKLIISSLKFSYQLKHTNSF
jgi:hypothetical protein